MAKNKAKHQRQLAKIRERKQKEKEKEMPDGILYVCTECKTQEYIPEDVVIHFDLMDDGDINEPPTFSCENCGAIMRPKKYEGVHGITYKF